MTQLGDVLALYERWGGERYDEELAQLDHALQTAGRARSAGASDELVAAALLHDVGHLLFLAGEARGPHEATGPAFLADLFPQSVLAPIALHVQAKRFLCAVEPTYHNTLSAGSAASLARQGGAMTSGEVVTFESVTGWSDAVALRRWDDVGKDIGRAVGDAGEAGVAELASYEPLLRSLVCSAS